MNCSLQALKVAACLECLQNDKRVTTLHHHRDAFLIATGTNSTPEMMPLYFRVLLISAVAAAEPASWLHAKK